MKKVITFGVFDGLHKGHQYFLAEAKKLGDYLVAVVATDENVIKLKGSPPRNDFRERIKRVKNEISVDEAVSSDDNLNAWKVLEARNPDIIAIGYDQNSLRAALEEYLKKTGKKIELKTIASFKPEKYKSSLLNQQISR